jgi:HPt (histidine-containing phosphotransfer) domain-containing protein
MKKARPRTSIISSNPNEEFTKNSNELLRELLEIFIKETPHLQRDINEAFHAKQTFKLNNLLHKFLGSCIYCELDRLQESLIDLRASIKKDNYSMESLKNFNKEIKNALEEAKKRCLR